MGAYDDAILRCRPVIDRKADPPILNHKIDDCSHAAFMCFVRDCEHARATHGSKRLVNRLLVGTAGIEYRAPGVSRHRLQVAHDDRTASDTPALRKLVERVAERICSCDAYDYGTCRRRERVFWPIYK